MPDELTDSPDSGPSSAFGVPIFRAIWFASMSSNLGGLVQAVGASWLMTTLTDSPQYVALVQASTALPIMLFALLAGAIADNLDRRIVMICAQGFMLIVSTALAICAWYGVLTPWLLIAFTFAIGCGTALNNPAWQASVGDMVPRGLLPGAVALNSMGFNIARSVGPAVGGAIVAAAGAAAAFATNALSYVALLAVLVRWRPDVPPRTLPRERLDLAISAGVRYVAMSPNIRAVLLRSCFFGMAAAAVPALLPVVANDIIAGGPLVFGTLLGSFGVGAVVGALSIGRLRKKYSTEWIVRTASVAVLIGTSITGASTMLFVTMPALMLAGAGWVWALSTFNVSVQMAAPRWVVARALSLYQMVTFGGMAFGSWLAGYVASHYSVPVALYSAATLMAMTSLLGLIRPLQQIEIVDLAPLDHWREPNTAVPLEPRSGPVVITVEHWIAEKDIVAFLNVMNERRRICRRDGFLRWTLLRDLADPELWIERFHVPTWLDYVRDAQRRTRADAAIYEQVEKLHIDGKPAVVHRMVERQPGSMPTAQPPGGRELADPLTDITRAS
ncbi:MAG: MFS transporter [Anderseniella sp.]